MTPCKAESHCRLNLGAVPATSAIFCRPFFIFQEKNDLRFSGHSLFSSDVESVLCSSVDSQYTIYSFRPNVELILHHETEAEECNLYATGKFSFLCSIWHQMGRLNG